MEKLWCFESFYIRMSDFSILHKRINILNDKKTEYMSIYISDISLISSFYSRLIWYNLLWTDLFSHKIICLISLSLSCHSYEACSFGINYVKIPLGLFLWKFIFVSLQIPLRSSSFQRKTILTLLVELIYCHVLAICTYCDSVSFCWRNAPIV